MAFMEYIEILMVFISISFLIISWRSRNSPFINWPIIGMFPGLCMNVRHAHTFLTYLFKQTNGTFVFKGPWFTGMNYLVTCDPTIVHYTLSKNFTNFIKGDQFKQILDAFGDGIFNADSESWAFQRRVIHSLLKHNDFKNAVRRTMEEKIKNGLFLIFENAKDLRCEIDMQDVFQRFTFDSNCMMVLSYDPKCLSVGFPKVPFEQAIEDIEKIMFNRHIIPMSIWKLQRWLEIGEEKEMKKACEIFDNFVNECVERKKEQLRKNNKEEKNHNYDLLTYFLMEENDYKEEGEDVTVAKSNKFLRDMTFNLILAGRDGVAAGLTWLFWLVATHPNEEKKILHEIKENLGQNKWRLFSVEELDKLVYLHAAICETLRLYPPVPFEFKEPIESDVLPGGHKISRGMKILYSFYSMGRMEEIWGKDCLEFKPERWISETRKIKHFPSYKFIAFNAGPRTCLGKNLAFIQMKLVASAVLWNYSFQVVKSQPEDLSLSLILYMKHGFNVRVSKRFGY